MYLVLSVVLFALGLMNVALGIASIVFLHSGGQILIEAFSGTSAADTMGDPLKSLIATYGWMTFYFFAMTSIPLFVCSMLAKAVHRMRNGYFE